MIDGKITQLVPAPTGWRKVQWQYCSADDLSSMSDESLMVVKAIACFALFVGRNEYDDAQIVEIRAVCVEGFPGCLEVDEPDDDPSHLYYLAPGEVVDDDLRLEAIREIEASQVKKK